MASAEIFYPKEATISDAQGSFTSQSFDSPAMSVADKGSSVSVNWGGSAFNLYPNRESPSTYEAIYNYQGQYIKILAYRSTKSSKIYLITIMMQSNGATSKINFKP